jgi:hypothetical protein
VSGGRGQVHLGDLVRAVVALDVTEPAEVAAIAATMGLGGRSGLGGTVGEWGAGFHRVGVEVPDRVGAEVLDPVAGLAAHPEPPGVPEPAVVGDGGLSVLALRGTAGAVPGSDRLAGSDIGDAQALVDSGVGAGPMRALDPAWPARWAPGVMFATASTDVTSRRVDERGLARRVAVRPLIRELPVRARPTTRLGIQLLLDAGESMLPFRADQRWLRELAGGVVGRDRVAVLHFRGTPLRGVRRVGRRGWIPYSPPAAGAPVVLVSDLGLRRLPFSGDAAAGGAEWTDWLDSVARTGCPVVCLTPYEARAHPWAIRRRVSLVPLDRRTSIRSAWRETRRLRGEARG